MLNRTEMQIHTMILWKMIPLNHNIWPRGFPSFRRFVRLETEWLMIFGNGFPFRLWSRQTDFLVPVAGRNPPAPASSRGFATCSYIKCFILSGLSKQLTRPLCVATRRPSPLSRPIVKIFSSSSPRTLHPYLLGKCTEQRPESDS